MATTFNLELKKQPNSLGKYQVFIRITRDRKSKRVKTSVALNSLKDWNGKARNGKFVRASEPNAVVWNEALAVELEEARAVYREDKTASLASVTGAIRNEDKEQSFLDFARERLEILNERGASNFKGYQTFLRKFEAFLAQDHKTDLGFADLSPALVKRFEDFLLVQSNEHFTRTDQDRRLNPNYVKTILVKFRALTNEAIKQGLLKPEQYPFRGYKLKENKVKKEKLTASETSALLALDLQEGSNLWHARNAFFFSMYCAGIRVGDLLQLRWQDWDHAGRLEYQMSKTHSVKSIGLVDQARQILERYWHEGALPAEYIFPFLDSQAPWAKYTSASEKDTMPVDLQRKLKGQITSKNVCLNRWLKDLAEMAGINKNITFHIGRHSFAYQSLIAGTNSMIIKEALGHSSLAITERYLGEFKSKEVDSALQKVFQAEAPAPQKTATEGLLEALKALDPETLESVLNQLKNGK